MFQWSSAPPEEAQERRRRRRMLRYVVGRDSHAVRAAEGVPVVSTVVQAVHKVRGHSEQEKRAKARNPMGTNGVITQTAELLPGVSDVLQCIHRFRGEGEAAERARATSLQRYLAKDGALTRVAELLPGSNLVAAVCLETTGNHEEAKRAINLLQNWRDAGSADGALTRLAEMFPGTDLIAFGLHASHGDFAHALRSIVKTRYVDITGDMVAVCLATDDVDSLGIAKVIVGDVSVHPVSGPLLGALMDLVSKAIQNTAEASPLIDTKMITGDIWETIETVANNLIKKNIELQLDSLDEKVCTALQDLRPTLAKMRTNFVMRALIPESIPNPEERLIWLLQEVVPKITVEHGKVPQMRRLRPKYTKYRAGLPEAGAAASCLSFLGCCSLGLHTCALGCFAGCLAGALQGVRWASTRLVPMVNSRNDASETQMRRPPMDNSLPGNRNRRWSPHEDRGRPDGISVEIPRVPEVVAAVTKYILDDVLASWGFGRLVAKILRSAMRTLRPFLADLVVSRSKAPAQVLILVTIPKITALEVNKNKLELPQMPFLLFVDLRLQGPGPLIERVRAVMADKVVDNILERVAVQLPDIDLRRVVPQLESFAAPVSVQLKLGLEWEGKSLAQLVLLDPSVRLSLPQ